MRSLFQGHGHLTDPLEPRTPLSGRVSGLSNRKGTERAGLAGRPGYAVAEVRADRDPTSGRGPRRGRP